MLSEKIIMNSFLDSRVLFVVSCVFFRAISDVSYVLFVSDLYRYAGFILDFSFGRYVLSWGVFLVALYGVSHIFYKVSDYFFVSFLLAVISPLSSLCGLSSYDFYPLIVTLFSYLAMRVLQHGNSLSGLIPVLKVGSIRYGKSISVFISLLAVFTLVAWYFYSGAYRYFNLDLMSVYKYREESAKLASVGFFSYFNGWVYGVFSIFLMCVCLFYRWWLLLLFVFLIQVFFFAVSSHKSVLFYPFIIVGIWWFLEKNRSLSVIPLGFCVIFVLSLFLYIVFDHITVASLFIRRVFFVPALLSMDYFDFFSNNDYVFWSNSILKSVIEYPYTLSIPKTIGVYNGTNSSANNGYIASGYAHAGVLGVMFYTLVFSIFLKTLDSYTLNSDIPAWLALCMTIVPLRSALISSDLLTSLLTHGLLLSLALIVLFRTSKIFIKDIG